MTIASGPVAGTVDRNSEALRVLVVEDTADIATAVCTFLASIGFAAQASGTGEDGLETARVWRPSLIILDVTLPGMSGYEVLAQLRAGGDHTPVLILSATTDEMSKVRGFRIGADDYVTKPFGFRELGARVEALVRRANIPRGGEQEAEWGNLRVDLLARCATVDGHVLPLRPKELDLLWVLVTRPGEALSRERLLEEVWGYQPGIASRTVDWHVAELRRKLREANGPECVTTVWKVGYRWSQSPA